MARKTYQPWPPRKSGRVHGEHLWTAIAVLLMAAGLLLLLWCIPGWAWAALGGAALIVGGWLILIRCE